MTAPKTRSPLESFGPELMAALLRGGRERIVIPFLGPSGKRLAHSFQRRIHTLRRRMNDSNHPMFKLASRARVSIFWGERATEQWPDAAGWTEDSQGAKGAIVVIKPNDSEFTDTLRRAGIDLERDVPDEILSEDTPTTLDDLLSDLEKKS